MFYPDPQLSIVGEFLLPVETTSLSLGEHWRLPLHPLYIIRTQRKDSRLTHKYPSSLSNTTQLFAQCHLFLPNYSHSLNLTRHCCATVFKYIPLVAFLRTNKSKTEIRGLSVRNKSSQLMLWCYILFNVPYQDRRELALFTGDHLHRYRLRWLEWIFQRGYVPSLSINYVGMSKDMKKRLPQLYYIKTPLRFLFIFVFLCTRRSFFKKLLKGVCSCNNCLKYGKVKTNSMKTVKQHAIHKIG